MNMFWHPAIKTLRNLRFQYSSNMYPADYGKYYHYLPVIFQDGGEMMLTCAGYRSGIGSRSKAKDAFLSKARAYCKSAMETTPNHTRGDWHLWWVHDWLTKSSGLKRVVGCFAGQALPEELSLVCALAVESGLVSKGNLATWAAENLGQDCCGFVSSYLMALGMFESRITYIPKFRSIGGVATSISDIDYDNAILFADMEDGRPKIRPNPGNKSHIMIAECWETYGSTIYVAQSGSSKGGVDYDRIYEIIETPKSSDPRKAAWVIREKGKGKASNITCVITKRILSHAGAD